MHKNYWKKLIRGYIEKQKNEENDKKKKSNKKNKD
jgi:hypothetical protein